MADLIDFFCNVYTAGRPATERLPIVLVVGLPKGPRF